MSQPLSQHLILATETARLPERLSKTGFHAFEHGSILENIENAGRWLGPRETLEGSGTFRQIIPYIVLCVGDRIVSYTRATAGQEHRLHGRLSSVRYDTSRRRSCVEWAFRGE
ncbi:MAG: hypothetical protein HQK60_06495 [Deltaproteobacteria bacterium]|nr:hypothetical protein [Deltaproteobacteria bacterium]